MNTTFRAALVAMMAIAGIGLVARPALGQPTTDEYLCGSNAAKTFARFIVNRSKCVQRCVTHARRTSQLYGDCFAPFGGSTATCILDPVHGAEARARAGIVSRCAADCPECFAPTLCTEGEPSVTYVANQLDAFSSALVYCVEANGGTANHAEAACEDAVSRAVVKLGAARIRCYTRCYAGIYARSCPTCTTGQLPEGSCDPPAIDAATAACIARTEARATAVIDASCSAVGGNPQCYVDIGFDNGATWASFMGSAIDGQVLNLACGG